MRLGFIGLGLMGEPMAANLRRAGIPLTVWSRSPDPCARLAGLGADVAAGPTAVLAASDATIVMLAHEQAIEATLEPGGRDFGDAVRGHGVVHMGTVSPAYSAQLDRSVRTAGGWFVEAPVSGSRRPAEAGELVAMVAGPTDRIDGLTPALETMCRLVLRCGEPPSATRMKLAVNTLLIGMVTALAESWRLAGRLGLDHEVFAEAVRSGQLAAPVVLTKLDKLLAGDLSPQAGLADVRRNAQLIAAEAAAAETPVPLLAAALTLLDAAVAAGHADLDMVGVLHPRIS